MSELDELVRAELGARADQVHVGAVPVEGLRERARRRRSRQRGAAVALTTALAAAAGVVVLAVVPGAGSTHGTGPATESSSSPQQDLGAAPLLRWRDQLPRGGAAPAGWPVGLSSAPAQTVENGVLVVGDRRYPLPPQQSWRRPDSVHAVADTSRGLLVTNTHDPGDGTTIYVEAGYLTEDGHYTVAVDRADWVDVPGDVTGKADRFAWAEVGELGKDGMPSGYRSKVHVVRVSDGAQLDSADMPWGGGEWTKAGIVATGTISTLGPQGWTVWNPGNRPRVVPPPAGFAVPDDYPYNIPKPGMTAENLSLSGLVAVTQNECEAVVSLLSGSNPVWKSCEPDSIAAPGVLSPDGRYLIRLGLMELVDLNTGTRTPLTDLRPATVRAAVAAQEFPSVVAQWSADSSTVDIALAPVQLDPGDRAALNDPASAPTWVRCTAATASCVRLG